MGKLLLLSMMLMVWSFQAQGPGNCPVVEDDTQSFCESEGSGNSPYRPAVKHLVASGDQIAWYATAESDVALDPEEFLMDGEDYYAGNISGTCEERAVVTVTLFDSPNAGSTTHYEVAVTAAPFDLLDIYEPSILGAPQAGGTLTPALASGTTTFNPAVDGSGKFRYEVASTNENCPDDYSFIFITVVPEPQTPPDDDPGAENCPIVESTVQDFCESQGSGNDFYRPTVADLVATANGDDIVWFDSPTATEPLAWDELLVDGEDYYAGNASGKCLSRVKVDCIVNSSPNAGSTTFLTLCSESGPVDLLQYINASVLGDPDAGGSIEPPLSEGGLMFNPAVDAEGRYEYHVTSSNEFCKDDKAFIYITVEDPFHLGEDIPLNLGETDAPVDLFDLLGIPEGVSASVSPVLNSGTGVLDPAIDLAAAYTVTVDNPEGCEDDSVVVNVSIGQDDEEQNCPIVENSVQDFCASQGSGNDFYRPTVAHLEATANGADVVWFDTAFSGEPLSPDELLVDGEDYFAGNSSHTCSERQMVVVELKDTPNAGGTTEITVNASDAPFDLLERYNPSILGAPDAGGTFDPPLASGSTIFDPSVDLAGRYTYTVSGSSDCPDDSSFCTITIVDDGAVAMTAGDDAVAMYPNPSRGDLNISLEEGVSPISVRIIDINGHTVKSMKLNSETQLQSLDISSLRPSMYFAEIVTDKGKFVKRIIKN